MLYRFKPNDILRNRIRAYPSCEFLIYDRKIYYNHRRQLPGQLTSSTYPSLGKVNINELNIDRASGNLIYPFITKAGSLTSFRTISTTSFNADFSYGDTVTGSYPLEAGISRDRYSSGQSRPKITALQNTLNYYKKLSQHYTYSGSLGDKSSQELALINIPSIFYGSTIKKGSVDLKFYISGTLAAQAQDINRNGELIQTAPVGSNGSGSVAGVVLYDEGFMVLTGAWSLHDTHTEPYVPGEAAKSPWWIYFASTGSTGALENIPSSSFALDFKGTNYVNTLTMFAHAPRGELNHSNNPTFLEFDISQSMPITSSKAYVEDTTRSIKNIVYSRYSDPAAEFEKTTFISKVAIMDEQKNVIAIASLSKPLRKKEIDQYTIKLKLDI